MENKLCIHQRRIDAELSGNAQNKDLENEADLAWLEYATTLQFESPHWKEQAREEFIEEYLDKHSEMV